MKGVLEKQRTTVPNGGWGMSHFLLRATYFKKTNKQTNKKKPRDEHILQIKPIKSAFSPQKTKKQKQKNPKTTQAWEE